MASAKATTDHDEIRRWVEERGGYPAHVKRTGDDGDPGVLRIDYPGFSGEGTLERIDWDQFFEWFERDNLAFLYQDEGDSRFSKFVTRKAEGRRQKAEGRSRRTARVSSAKRSTAKKASAKRASSAKKTSAKKASAKKASAKRSTASKRSASAKRSTAKRSTAKRSTAKRATTAKRTASTKRTAAKRSTAKRPAKRAAAKRTTAKRSTAKRSTAKRATSSSRTSRSAKRTTDHDEIRRWVEARGGYPARVKRSGRGNDPGILRIDYPGFSGQKTLERIDWDEFFDWFDRDRLAFLYQDTPRSRFSKLVSR